MNYFRLAYDMIVNKFLFHLFIAVEIAGMLVLSNALISTYNSKQNLYSPFESMLEKEGFVLQLYGMELISMAEDDELQALIQKGNGTISTDDLTELLLNYVGTDAELTYSYTGSMTSLEGAPRSLMESDRLENESYVDFYYVDHDIFDKMNLPLEAGRWAASEKNENGETEVVISQGTDAVLNQVYNTKCGKFRVVGILTRNTYRPPVSYNSKVLGKLSIFDYYVPFDSSISTSNPFFIADLNAVQSTDFLTLSDCVFVSFSSSASDERKNQIRDYLLTFGNIREIYGQEDFTTIHNNSYEYLMNIYRRMLPMIIVVNIIVIAGLIGSAAIFTIKYKRYFGIFFLCGCRWKDCIKIIMAYLSIIYCAAVILTFFAFAVMKLINLDYLIGTEYSYNNLLFSFLELILMYLLAIILPHTIIKTTSPVETLREN